MSEIETYLSEVEARQGAARDVVSDLCEGRRKWTMSVPAQPGDDPDLVISGSLRDIPRLLALVRHYREALAEGLACLRLAADTARIHENERLTVTLDNACRQVSAALHALMGEER